ncbi:uncharacterized protein V1518DRAFT_416882 [Limtongia smithiae]|uniref:uncharacterized protein n=1 Tax=Limtongia smithiae TaxID=1125753 RepID=UPI0034CD395B
MPIVSASPAAGFAHHLADPPAPKLSAFSPSPPLHDGLLSDAASTSSVSSAFSTLSTDTALSAPDGLYDLALATPKTAGTAPGSPIMDHSAHDADHGFVVSAAPDIVYTANDDTVIQYEPSRHVDYLSHNWKESDISSSWRYIVLRRKDVANSARLENASWRTWTKAKYHLKTVSPESVNWLKDYDVTWLYGPLATQPSKDFDSSIHSSLSNSMRNLAGAFSPPSRPANPQSSIKKPILKKRSMSEVMLARAMSSSNLLKQAAATVAAQRHLRAPGTRPTTASYSSEQSPYISISPEDRHDPRFPSPLVAKSFAASAANFGDRLTYLNSTAAASTKPDKSAGRHIHFSDRVEQCIALEQNDDDMAASVPSSTTATDDETEDEEPGLFLMVRSGSGSFQRPASLEPHTIAKLPATRLKYVADLDDNTHHESSGRKAVMFSMGQSNEDSDSAPDEDDEDSEDEPMDYYGHDGDDEFEDEENDYFSLDRSRSREREDERHNRFQDRPASEDLTTPTQETFARQPVTAHAPTQSLLRKSTSQSSLVASASLGNLNSAHSRYLEDATMQDSQHQEVASTSESDDEEIVDMDSSLIANLRRDSVVLARGRISDPLSPTTSSGFPMKSISQAAQTEPPAPASTGEMEVDAPTASAPSANEGTASPSTSEEEQQGGFWGQVVSATKDLTQAFMNGGWKGSS